MHLAVTACVVWRDTGHTPRKVEDSFSNQDFFFIVSFVFFFMLEGRMMVERSADSFSVNIFREFPESILIFLP